jgi:hypothetical protein
MSASRSFALLIFSFAGAVQAQSADLRITSSASPSNNLVVGQEILITTTAINDGPDAAQDVLVFWSAPLFQPFVLEDAQPVTPGCNFEIYDIDPPRFNFTFFFPTLAAGEQRTCVARVRVRVIPSDHELVVGADANSAATPDPQLANNTVLYRLTFATPAPLTIPSTTSWGLTVLVAGALSLVFIQRSGGRR